MAVKNKSRSNQKKHNKNDSVQAKVQRSKQKRSFLENQKDRIGSFLARRSHRSFRLTKHRDYVRKLQLPGYVSFSFYVASVLGKHKKTFTLLVLFYLIIAAVFGILSSQDTYNQLSGVFDEVGSQLDLGFAGSLLQAGVISITVFTGNSSISDVQRVYAAILLLLVWLSTVWLLREFQAGRRPNMRDGLYNSSAPIVSTALVSLWIIVQLIPIAVVAVIYSSLVSYGMLDNGFAVFLASMVAVVAVSMSAYWMTSTFMALVIVTIPGMYPMRAMRLASDLVLGRRLRILLRLLWLVVLIFVTWLLIMVPMVLIESWLTSMIDWFAVVPILPIFAGLLSGATVVWSSAYVYLLYRKVIENDEHDT